MNHFLKFTPIILLVLSLTRPAKAQNAYVDSVKRVAGDTTAGNKGINALLELSFYYRFSYPDSGLRYGEQALSRSQKTGNDTLIFWSYVSIGSCLYPLGNFSAELDNAYRLQPVAKRLNTMYARGYSNGVMSDAYLNFGEYSTSLDYWRKVVAICEKEAPEELASIYGNAGYIFDRAGMYDSALIYTRKSFSVMYHIDKIYKDSNNLHFFISNICEAMGEAFAGKQLFDSALICYQASLASAEKIDMRFSKIDACNGIAAIYKRAGRNDSAIYYCNKVFALDGAAARYPIAALKTATLLAGLYEKTGRNDSSLKYMHLASDIKDSVYSREKTAGFQNIIFREKEKANAITSATERLQSRYRILLIVLLFITGSIIAAWFLKNRRNKQLQHIRNSIADDLHDDIGSTLSSISILNELAKEKSPEALPLLNSIGESTSEIQDNMSDIVWTVNPKNDHFENLLERMYLFAREILDAKNIRLEFKNDKALEKAKLTMKQRKNLYLFFKESVNNAAKHSRASCIAIEIKKIGHAIGINISDNGIGFTPSDQSTGNGMNSLKRRAEELNAVYNITSLVNGGTTVRLHFKTR